MPGPLSLFSPVDSSDRAFFTTAAYGVQLGETYASSHIRENLTVGMCATPLVCKICEGCLDKLQKIKVYLDNCAYNRPFDNQSHIKIILETEAKQHIQQLIINKAIDLIYS